MEDKYLDVLQNIEVGIISVYRQESRLLDYDVLDAIEALIRDYTAEEQQRHRATLHVNPTVITVAARLRVVLRS